MSTAEYCIAVTMAGLFGFPLAVVFSWLSFEYFKDGSPERGVGSLVLVAAIVGVFLLILLRT